MDNITNFCLDVPIWNEILYTCMSFMLTIIVIPKWLHLLWWMYFKTFGENSFLSKHSKNFKYCLHWLHLFFNRHKWQKLGIKNKIQLFKKFLISFSDISDSFLCLHYNDPISVCDKVCNIAKAAEDFSLGSTDRIL